MLGHVMLGWAMFVHATPRENSLSMVRSGYVMLGHVSSG